MERFLDAVMPTVLEITAGLFVIAVCMGWLILSTGGCPPKRRY